VEFVISLVSSGDVLQNTFGFCKQNGILSPVIKKECQTRTRRIPVHCSVLQQQAEIDVSFSAG
jgi:hypothetical protein